MDLSMFMRQYVTPVCDFVFRPFVYLTMELPYGWPTWIACIWDCVFIVGMILVVMYICRDAE